MSMQILTEELKKGKIRNLYLFYGPEEYLKNYYLEVIEKNIIDEQFKQMNKVVLDGKVDVSKIIDNCLTVPLFSDKKLVVAKNTGLFKSNKVKGEDNNPVQDLFQGIPEYTCLVFYEEEVDKRLKAYKTIKGNGLVVEFELQKPGKLVTWVMKIFRSYNKEISTAIASKLVDYCEPGMTEILNEIEKVILYMGDRKTATFEDLEQVCTKSIKSRIFDLTDAISEKDSAKALKLLDDMILLKEPIQIIMFMITRQIRQVLEMKLLLQDRVDVKMAASKMKVHPYAAKQISKQANRFSVETLKRALQKSYELDVGIKTGQISDRMAAELLITEFYGK
jgi:DNA polymerase-3 subunit delta